MASFVLVKRATLFAALLLSLSLLLIASLAQAYGPNGEENRCTELGASCLCSEPQNTNSYIPDGAGVWWNPADTTGSKQGANNGQSLFSGTLVGSLYIDPNAKAIPEANLVSGGYGDRLPAGTQVRYVYLTQDNDSYPQMLGKPTGSGVRRMCMRHYFMRDKDMIVNAIKDMNMHVGNIQNIWGNGSSGTPTNGGGPVRWMSIGQGPCWPGCDGTGNINTQQACIGHWCRVEFCAYGALTGPGNVYVEGYLVRVNDPSIRQNWGPVNYGDLPADGTGDGLGNMIWLGSGISDAENVNPAKFVSHAMQAAWSTDSPGLFIGPAAEIEGGTPGGTPPPPPPPPAPPVLLP